MAETEADNAGVPGLIDTLAVFIKQERAKSRGVESACNERRKEDDSSWASKYPIQIHSSIITWKAKKDNGGQGQCKCQAVRCAFNWEKSEEGLRLDHIWVQEYPTGAINPRRVPYPWQDRMIGELQLVLTVRDEGLRSEDGYTQLPNYTWALVKLLQWRQQRSVHPTDGMVEVEPWPTTEARNQRFLTREKIYSIPHIIRGANVVTATAPPIQYWFVNNYIDWE